MALVTYTRLGMNARRLYWEIVSHPNIQLLATMNEGSGNVLDRCVRNRLSGTVGGSPTRGVAMANGFVGMSLTAGTPDYLTFGIVSALNFGTDLPYSLLAVLNPDVTGEGHIMGVRNDQAGSTAAWEWWMETGRQLSCIIQPPSGGSGQLRVRGNTALTNGTSYIVGMTYDGGLVAAGVQYYVNGSVEAKTITNNNLVGSGHANNQEFTIGAHKGGGGTYTEGLNANAFGFVAVFNAVLTAAEIRRYAWLGGFL